MTQASITSGQREAVEALVKAAGLRGIEIGLKRVDPGQDGVQLLLERGDDFQAPIVDAVIAALKQMSVGNQYANLVTASDWDYPAEYRQNMPTIEQQIDILRMRWKSLNPDNAIRYAREVYPTLDCPEWVESPFVLIRPGFFSDKYGEEVEEVLKAIDSTRKLYNYREGCLGPQYLQREERSLRCEARMAELQPGDLWIVGGQFGKHHRGEAVLRARELISCRRHEWAFGARDVGYMTFTHPHRFVRWEQLHADCAGDKYSPGADGSFGRAPLFCFADGRVEFGSGRVGNANDRYGSVSGLVPQQ